MKRSEVNQAIKMAMQVIESYTFALPPFAFWTRSDWEQIGSEADEIRTRRLGWDVTDLGTGRFSEVGCVLFTLRNGKLDDPANVKAFAEKIIIMQPGQRLPWHFHFVKTEDIINRGSGEAIVELCNSTADEKFDNTPVCVSCDGIERTVEPGGAIQLRSGESVTLCPRVYHQFTAPRDGPALLLGEVSSVNDDAIDNRFYEPLPRFPQIQGDEPALRLLCGEYPTARR